MKHRWPFVLPFCAALGLLLGVASVGCNNPATTTPPAAALAPGYLNPTDKSMGIALAGVRTFYVSFQCSTLGEGITQPTPGVPAVCDPTKKVTVYVPSAAEKTAYGTLYQSINLAQAAYTSFHASPNVVTEDEANSAIQKAVAQQQALQPTIPGVS